MSWWSKLFGGKKEDLIPKDAPTYQELLLQLEASEDSARAQKRLNQETRVKLLAKISEDHTRLQRYRDALEWYARHRHWQAPEGTTARAHQDAGLRARKALGLTG